MAGTDADSQELRYAAEQAQQRCMPFLLVVNPYELGDGEMVGPVFTDQKAL